MTLEKGKKMINNREIPIDILLDAKPNIIFKEQQESAENEEPKNSKLPSPPEIRKIELFPSSDKNRKDELILVKDTLQFNSEYYSRSTEVDLRQPSLHTQSKQEEFHLEENGSFKEEELKDINIPDHHKLLKTEIKKKNLYSSGKKSSDFIFTP